MSEQESQRTGTSTTRTLRRTDPKDPAQRYFRSVERFFCSEGQWYFATREGDCGPFRSKEAAMREVARYLDDRAALQRFQRSRESRGLGGFRDSLTFALVPLD